MLIILLPFSSKIHGAQFILVFLNKYFSTF